eukprot:s1235_g8.t1
MFSSIVTVPSVGVKAVVPSHQPKHPATYNRTAGIVTGMGEIGKSACPTMLIAAAATLRQESRCKRKSGTRPLEGPLGTSCGAIKLQVGIV